MKEEKEINIYEVTEKDKELSFECITGVEKRLINVVRLFRTQQWLQARIADVIGDVVSDFVDMSLNRVVYERIVKDATEGNVSSKNIDEYLGELEPEVKTDEDLIEDLTKSWTKAVLTDVYGDITPISENNIE